jgi:hypothetical protein
MSKVKPQLEAVRKHPVEYQRGLNPNSMAGQNVGAPEVAPEVAIERMDDTRTAYDIKDIHRRLAEIPNNELKDIRVLAEGSRLLQGATYLDLKDLEKGEFTATADMEVLTDSWIIAKKNVPYTIWNLFLGIDSPERISEANLKKS